MLDFIGLVAQIGSILWCVTLCVAGIKACIWHDGPGMFELVGMLWRGEIKTRAVR